MTCRHDGAVSKDNSAGLVIQCGAVRDVGTGGIRDQVAWARRSDHREVQDDGSRIGRNGAIARITALRREAARANPDLEVARSERRNLPAGDSRVREAAGDDRRVDEILVAVAQDLGLGQRMIDRPGCRERIGDYVAQSVERAGKAGREEMVRAQAEENRPQLGGVDACVRQGERIAPLGNEAVDDGDSVLVYGEKRTCGNSERALRFRVRGRTRSSRGERGNQTRHETHRHQGGSRPSQYEPLADFTPHVLPQPSFAKGTIGFPVHGKRLTTVLLDSSWRTQVICAADALPALRPIAHRRSSWQ